MVKRKAETETETVVMDWQAKRSKTPKSHRQAYTPAQKAAIQEFTNVTQSDKSTAAKFLKNSNWNVGVAANTYFNNPTPATANPLRNSLSKTFDKYRDDPKQNPDEINMEGCQKLMTDLDIEISDVGALVLFEIVQSPSLGNITREGFVDGWTDVGVDALPKMRNVILQRRSQLPSDTEVMKNVYNHTFTIALSEKQKSLPVEMATEFWRLLFTAPSLDWRTANTPWLDWWLEFYENKIKKAVNKDMWKQTLNFALETLKDDSLGFWSEESSWPSVIDEFVEWVKEEKRPTAGDPMEVS